MPVIYENTDDDGDTLEAILFSDNTVVISITATGVIHHDDGQRVTSAVQLDEDQVNALMVALFRKAGQRVARR